MPCCIAGIAPSLYRCRRELFPQGMGGGGAAVPVFGALPGLRQSCVDVSMADGAV